MNKNTRLFISCYGSALCLGIEALTPIAESPADRQAADQMAKEAIEQTANQIGNAGGYDGEPIFTHSRFAYVCTSQPKLVRAFESLIIAQTQWERFKLSKEAKRNFRRQSYSATKRQSREMFNAIPRESGSFLAGLSGRNQSVALMPVASGDANADCGVLGARILTGAKGAGKAFVGA